MLVGTRLTRNDVGVLGFFGGGLLVLRIRCPVSLSWWA